MIPAADATIKKNHIFRLLTVVLTMLVGGIVLETGCCLYLRTDRERNTLRIFVRSDGGGVDCGLGHLLAFRADSR